MIQRAIDKIKKEIEADKSENTSLIGEYIINVIINNTENAQAVLAEDKTMDKLMDSISSKAKEKSTGNHAVISCWDVFNWVNEYYGVAPKNFDIYEWTKKEFEKSISGNQNESMGKSLNINLLDLLG